MQLTRNFELQEFVHPEIYRRIGNRSADFLHPLLARTIQELRNRFGKIIINDWLWGGELVDSGLRLPQGTVGADLSAHRFGCAADIKIETVIPIDVQQQIMQHQHIYPHITRMENADITKTWLHIEVGKRKAPIVIYNP